MFDGFYQSLAAYANAGNNLILEHILDTAGWADTLKSLFEPHDVLFVAVHCSLPVLNAREQERGDRQAGSAQKDYFEIHKGRLYDLEIHSEAGVEENVGRILDAWNGALRQSEFASGSNR